QGVTILSSSSMEGDALSTTCLILGAEKGLSYIESLDEVEALFILDNGEIRTTSGFPEYALP
nr:FAD:protein FMN transferase [Lachnospiraceae bacterium]